MSVSSGPPPCGGRCRAVLQPSDTIRWATADLASGARPSAAVRESTPGCFPSAVLMRALVTGWKYQGEKKMNVR